MTLTWSADLTKTDVVAAGFQNDNWNRDDGAGNNPVTYGTLTWPMAVAAAPDGVRSTQAVMPGGYKRNEVVSGAAELTTGDNFYFGQTFYAPAGFDLQATAGSGFQVITQFRQSSDDGSPVAAFELRNGNLLLTGGYGVTGASPANKYQYTQTLVTGIATGHRYQLLYRIGPFSTANGAATIDVWVDGAQVLTSFTIPCATLYAGTTQHKSGLYRDPGNTTTETLWQAGHCQGTTYADVAAVATVPAPVATGTATTLPAIRRGSFYAAM